MSGNRILIVDSNIGARNWIIENVARPAGYVIAEATNLVEARAQLAAFQPHLIVLALGLGSENAPRLLHDYEAALPIIVTTMHRSADEVCAAQQAGAGAVLIKPFEPEELMQAIARLLRSSHSTRDYNALRQQVEQQAQEFNAVYTIGKNVTAALDIEEILSGVVSAAVHLTHSEEGSLMLLDHDTDQLFLCAHKNLDETTTQRLRIRVTDPLMHRVLSSQRPVMQSGNVVKLQSAFLAKAILAVPIMADAQVIGVLNVDNKIAARTFHEHDVHLMTILSDYAAIALENARLYAAKENERQRLETILRDTQDAVIVTDAKQRIVLANPAACSAFGLNTEPHGLPLSEAVDNRAVLDLFAQGRRHPHAWHTEIQLSDGRTLRGQLSHLSGVGFGVVMQDISQLKELDRIKSEFISTASHDLRTPLTSIRGYIGLLPRVGPLNEQQQDFVVRADRSMNNIIELINDLLNISRIEAGLDWEMLPLDLHKVIEDSAAGLQQSAAEKHQMLHLNVPDASPLLGNVQRLKQVVDNLIGNAIKYTPEGGHIDVTLSEQGNFLMLRVRDTGIGIAPADQSRIFEKFYRVQSDQTLTISGTGLGLSIVQAIVEKHDGRVWVESKEGHGSTFTVLLPTCQPVPIRVRQADYSLLASPA